MRIASCIVLTEAERAELEALAGATTGNARLVQRARMILLASAGWQNKDIAAQTGVGRVQVARWRDRYAMSRLAGIVQDLPRGAPPVRTDVARLVALAREASPGSLSTRQLATELGVSAASVSRHWRASGLPPRQDRQQLPGSGTRLAEIVGVYVCPPEHAIVVALEPLPAPMGTPAMPIVSAERNSATYRRTLAASFLTALTVLDGDAAPGLRSERHADWLAFLQAACQHAPAGRQLLVIADNPVSHDHPAVRRGLPDPSRLDLQFAPGTAAWLRTIQRLLRDAANGLPAGIPQLLAAVNDHAGGPFRWIRDVGPAAQAAAPVPAVVAMAPAPLSAPYLSLVPEAAPWPVQARALQPVASAKLLPPRHARKLLPRERLMARLLDARRQRCIVIQGQAGAGKTSTLMTWRKALISLGFDVSWLALSVEDNEPARFFDCLLASMAEIDPAIARDAAMLLGGPQDDDAIEHWVIALVQALGQRERELVLMLDDLHHITDARIYRALQRLLDYAPAQLHLALSSRSALPLALEPLRAQGSLTEIDMRDLRFTEEESARFLQEQLGTIPARDAAALHALTDGWVAGLQLFAVDLRARRGGDYPLAQVRDPRAFAAYFEREVLGRLAPDDLAMLTRMATCHRFCADLCAAMPGETETPSRIGARLARLDADNLFITQVGSHDRDVWYRIHPLLRETLLARLGQGGEGGEGGDGGEAARALHAAAWRWFDQRGQLDDAVYHAVRAGEAAAAAAMVEACGQALLARGELSQLQALLRMLPSDEVRGRVGLQTLLAYLQLYARDVEGLRQSLAQLEPLRDGLDAVSRYTIYLLRAGLSVQLDDADTVLGMLPVLWAIPPEADDLWWTSRSNVLSWFFMLRGEYDEARRLQEDTDRRSGAPRSSLFGRYITAMSLMMEGQIERAGKTAREVLRESERQGAAFVGLTCMAAGLLADILYELNDAEGACQLLEPRIGMLERVSLPDVVLRALSLLSNAHWMAGRRAQASACLDRLEAYAVRYDLDRLLAEALVLRLRRHLQQAEMERANTVLQCVQALAGRNAGKHGTVAHHITRAAARADIEMSLYTQDYAGAAARIEPLLADDAGGKPLRTAGLWLQLALARQSLGNVRAARPAFLCALREGHDAGLIRTLLDVTGGAPQALAALAGDGVAEPVLAFYARRLQSAAAAASAAASRPAAGAAPSATLSEREREILGLLAQAMSNKKIASVLNVSPETVKWHLKNIYTKLGVTGRGRAAARLRDLAAQDQANALAA
ncbi:helix-turn-helix domain-containing protein [Cupriavidus necator]|uniref:Serine/threonine protein kinase n=1 Tax=Cupriavidus necator TaxID=106590 RepID=A0A367PKA3_CUPNE|nr:LuxR C-terminal-related transcriptional regulator [Cupriavidus necator]QQX82816.1 helix-turn-helix domain-containing protein [Cupriavidus necator]RCJ07446.1 serine/threonine protein kinase [Cupriavidus necator]